jgi:probable F420-dependent oxidoreductase
VRIDRMAEALTIIKSCFAGGTVSFTGKHYKVESLEAYPSVAQKPHPPIVLGGGGRRMLQLAAREADIVSVNYNLSEGRINRKLVQTGLAEATQDKLLWIKEAAGDRFSEIELAVSIFVANVTDDRDAVAEVMAPGIGCEPRDVLEMPHFLIGTVEQIVEDLKARRERFGISYLAIPGEAAEAMAPVVERLTGT